MVLVGVQPVLMQVPPTSARSITAVRLPLFERATARGLPPWPEPMMIASKCVDSGMSLLLRRGETASLYVRDDEEGAADCDDVFDQSYGEVGKPGLGDEESPDVISAVGADQSADDADE